MPLRLASLVAILVALAAGTAGCALSPREAPPRAGGPDAGGRPARPCPPVPPGVIADAGHSVREAADLCWWEGDEGHGQGAGGTLLPAQAGRRVLLGEADRVPVAQAAPAPLTDTPPPPPPPPAPLDPDWEIDPATLVLQGKIGEGEFGIVHRALWHGTTVAAKVLKESTTLALRDLRTEIEVLRRVRHPNAVQFLGACTKDPPFILVTELMCGGSVADALSPGPSGTSGGLTPRRALEIALDTARGVAYLHGRPEGAVVHRDLKPGNLMVAGSPYVAPGHLLATAGTVKIADFGLSTSLPKADTRAAGHNLDAKFNMSGGTGSFRYMAPEVFRHEPYNHKVDVYSFAMLTYQLFENVMPFAGTDPVEAANLAAFSDRRPPFRVIAGEGVKAGGRGWAAPLRAVIEACWDPDPERRPSMEDAVEMLEDILQNVPRPDGGAGGAGGGGAGCGHFVQ